jgi:outer membrane receptor for ferrienterochelin and colicins
MSIVWKTACACLMAVMPSAIFAQGLGRIEGQVVDEDSRRPLPMANVILRGTTLGAATGREGRYLIVNVPAGEYRLTVTMIGYGAVTKAISVSAGERSHLDLELKPNAVELGGIVVTATRTPRYIKDVPIRTEVITSQNLEEKAAPNLYEALEGVPGLRVEQQCSYCNFSMLRMQGLEGDHVQLLIDGQPIYSGLASVYGLQQVAAGQIDRIEIVKGAGSALYGSSAVAGVVNVITKTPNPEPSVEVSVSFGNHATNEYSIAASRRSEDTDAMVFATKLVGGEVDENEDGITDRVKTDNTSIGTRINAYNLLGDDRITLSGKALNELRQGGELETWENPFAAGAENIETARYEASLDYSIGFSSGKEIGLNFGYAAHKRHATNDAFLGDYMTTHGDTAPPVDEMEPYVADENLHVLNVNYAHPVGRYRLLAGVAYCHNILAESGRYVIVDENDPDYGCPYSSDSEKSAHEIGFYLQGEFPFVSDAIELVAGARYDTHRSRDNFGGSGKVAPKKRIELEYSESAFSPRAAFMYKVIPEFALRASVGTGFRVPYGFSEDLHLCSGSPRINKPTGLRSEKSISANLGADYDTDRLGINLSFFRTNIKDMVGFRDAGEESKRLGYSYEWANMGRAHTQGIELGSEFLIVESIYTDLNLTYTDARYEQAREDWANHPTHGDEYAADSKQISRIPDITLGIKLGYSPGDWSFVAGADYSGRMYIDYCKDEQATEAESYIRHTDPFFTLNARISKAFADQTLTIFVGGKNLNDYVQPERHTDDAAFIYAPLTGRTIYGGMKLQI